MATSPPRTPLPSRAIFLRLFPDASTLDGFTPQDFEAITPNVLARTVETIEGGGVVVLLLKSMESLKQVRGRSSS